MAHKPFIDLTEDERIQAVADLIRAGLGPVEIARNLGVSRPTANKYRALAVEREGLPTAPAPKMTGAGGKGKVDKAKARTELNKAGRAKQLLAQGKTKKEVKEELGLGKAESQRVFQAASTAGTATMLLNPEAMDKHLAKEFDVMASIQASLANLEVIEKETIAHLNLLKTTTQHDIDRIGEGDELHGGFHSRMANIRGALDLARKLQESRLKGVQLHQKILEYLYDVKRVHDTIKDMANGTRDALTILYARGDLAIPVEEALALVRKTTRETYAKRTGIV